VRAASRGDEPIRPGGNLLPTHLWSTPTPSPTGDASIASVIDHTILRADADRAAIDRLCDDAIAHGFASVCLNPVWVAHAADRLRGQRPVVCTVVGFPLGAMHTEAKADEARVAVREGASEVDMVQNVGELRTGRPDVVLADMMAVREAIGRAITLKVILETCLLTDEEIERACALSVEARADYVKTSTGFSTAGATEAHVQLMARSVGTRAKVKASGGIRTLAAARGMLRAGASRIGASAGVAMVTEERETPAEHA